MDRSGLAAAACGAALVLAAVGVRPAQAEPAQTPYASMGPAELYAMDRAAEIALAREAAPESISRDAAVLVMGPRGYETAAAGSNGFTCLVERSWGADFPDPEFWNPKIRSAICFNAAATRSVLPTYLKRSEWVLAGVPKAEMLQRTRAAVAAKEILPPEPGAMCFMMSKDGYLSDKAGGHWHPHLMYYVPRVEAASWGANRAGSPVIGGPLSVEPMSLFLAPVLAWSDGSPGPMMRH